MKFYVSSAFLDTREIVEVAKAADDLGYDGIGIPDHIVNLESLEHPVPLHQGRRSGAGKPFTEWPDPWVLVGALAQVTTRLRFVTTVYIPAMRNPYSAAKAIGTAAYLADGRVELGVGVGWCEEEFDLMEQRFAAAGQTHRRDARSDADAVVAGLDGIRRRVLQDTEAGDAADAAARYRSTSVGSVRSRCAGRPDTTAGSAT